MGKVLFSSEALLHFVFLANNNRKTQNKVHDLIKDIERNGLMNGIGKPERWKHEDGLSRRIDDTNRLIYNIKDEKLHIISCKGHYED